jgi:arylsulfatase A
VQWRGNSLEGGVCHDLVDFTDFLPTLCQAAGIDVPDDLVLDGKTFLPQVYGKKGDPREWIYCWYDPHGKDLKEFVQDKRFKLYRTGEFYNVEEDLLEKNPLNYEVFGKEEKKALLKFEEVLSMYDTSWK